MVEEKSFQDYYPEENSHCYGCGSLNEKGLHIKSYWDGEESVAHLMPKPYHIATPGFVYGGLIASLIDCHGVGTAAAATCRAEGRAMDEEPRLRFVTASLKVDYIHPTPLGVQLEAKRKGERRWENAKYLAGRGLCKRNSNCARRRYRCPYA